MRHKSSDGAELFTRRTFLQGSGAVIALPFLPSLLPRSAWAAASSTAPPTRFISYFLPLGMINEAWKPTTTGLNYKMSPTLAPVASFVNDFTVISNTNGGVSNQPQPSAGGHAKGVALYCTATRIAPVGNVKLDVSFDQVVAQAIGNNTRLPSVQLALNDDNPWADTFDANYLQCISWSSPTSPLPALASPAAAFRTLFPAGQVQGQTANKVAYAIQRAAAQPSLQRSILDAAVGQASALQARMGVVDRQLLDQYLTNLREVEKTLPPDPVAGMGTGTGTGTGTGGGTGTGTGTVGSAASAACVVPGSPADSQKSDWMNRIDQYTQLMPLALACDQTRVISFAFSRGMSDRVYKNVGASSGHHLLSHWNLAAPGLSSADKVMWLKKIQIYEMQCFAKLLTGLKGISDTNGTLLDNTVVYLSSELSNSAEHKQDDMPVLIAGGGGGRIKSRGQHIAAPSGSTYAQTLLTAIRATGVQVDKVGTTGATESIAGVL